MTKADIAEKIQVVTGNSINAAAVGPDINENDTLSISVVIPEVPGDR